MTGEEVRELRKQMKLSAHALAQHLSVEPKLVLAWESGDRFPTKKHCERMKALARDTAREDSAPPPPPTDLAALTDPELWKLLRKLVAYPKLREQAQQLAEQYEDPKP